MPSNTSKETEELINSLKSNLCIWEDLISKSLKFHNSIKLMTLSSSDLLDSLHSVCDIASKSPCCIKNTGISLTKLVLRQKKIEQKVSTLNSYLNENLSSELDKFLVEWRKTSLNLKRERDHDWKKANLEYQKSLAEVERTEKKLRKKNAGKVGLSETASLQIDYANQDAQNKRRYVEELERSAMRRAAIEERQRFKQFLVLLKPILDCQLSMREDLDNLEEVVSQLYGEKSENLDEFPEELEQNIQEHTIDNRSTTCIPRSYSTLSKQKSTASTGSHSSLNSNSMSTTSSEWNNNNLITACMEMSSRLNENMSNLSHDSGIKSDKSLSTICDNNSNHDENVNYNWDRTLSNILIESANNESQQQNDSDTECSSSEDENDASTDHNSQDGVIDNANDVFPLPEQQTQDNEVHFELPLDYQDNLPPPPTATQALPTIPTMQATASHYQQPITIPNDNLYPNQSIPPPVYSNLQELKLNAAKKFGANTLSRISIKDRGNLIQAFNEYPESNIEESSTSFLGNSDKDKPTIPKIPTSQTKATAGKIQEAFHRSQSSVPVSVNDENPPSFNYYNDPESSVNATKIPLKGDSTIKPSMIRRGSFTTEMQVPQTPKNFNTVRKSSTQERTPLNMYSNKNRGRSMSVTREIENDHESPEKSSEDFNAIRQRIVNRINGEASKPVTLPKPELPKKQSPSSNYMAYEYSNTLSSPVALRSNRFFNDRMLRQTNLNAPSGQNIQQMKYQQSRIPSDRDHDIDSAAGEEPACNDFNMSTGPEPIPSMHIERKDDKFKHQLIQMLHSSKSQEAARVAQIPASQHASNISSFYHGNPNHPNHPSHPNNNSSHQKSRTKSTIPNSKYCY